jgi:3-methyladenine DNA glycosylase AlkD
MDGFEPEGAALAVTEALRAVGTAKRAAQEKRYLKSELEFLGVTVPEMRRVVTGAVRGYPGLDAAGMVAWAVALWGEPVHERRMAAVEILTTAAPRLGAADLAVTERLVRQSGTWALVDGLAANVAGQIALRDPRSWPVIDRWAVDADFWVRRSALLALLLGIRRGQPDLARFTRYAEPMLADGSSSSARRSAGYCGRSPSAIRPGWRPGRSCT